MNSPTAAGGYLAPAVRGALRQARTELRIQLLSWNVLGWVMFPAIGLGVLYFLQSREVMGTEISLAQIGIPGMLATTLVTSGVMGAAGQLLTEREDGTLLRAKAVPNGMLSHLMGNVLIFTTVSLVPVLGMLVAASLLFADVAPPTAPGWVTFAWVAVLGMFAALPLGALLGAVMRSPVALGWSSLVVYGSMAISGVFYPLQALPQWLQYVGQVLPTYWLGLGLRSALLPAEAVALELGGSWRQLETVTVLGTWAVLGLVLAPIALRRMARRTSGSTVSAARERVMARGY